MADLIQFPCPVCAATLRLPLEMAGRQGPCPRCGSELIAPDPYRGVGATEVPPVALPPAVESFKPFVETPAIAPASSAPPPPDAVISPPAAAEEPKPSIPSHPPHDAITLQPEGSSRRAVFVLSILLTAVVSLVAGYLLGARSNWLISRTPYPVMSPVVEPAPAEAPLLVKPAVKPDEAASTPGVELNAPDPLPPVEEPKPAKEPEKTSEPKKASSQAEAALKAFLDAPDWATRSAYVLYPENVRAAMEEYSRKHPDGPTANQSVTIQNSYTDKTTGNTLFIFKVTTELQPSGFPVAVAETASGWCVDWQSFVEFRDDHFKTFADGPAGKTGHFHLIVSPPAAPRAANTENEYFSSFLLDPPLPGRQKIAYAKKTTEVYEKLAAATANGTSFTPVLELAKRSTPDGKSYLEILAVTATDWLPENL